MPICPRCGKCLSSEQALSYHLNRKYKCGFWTCGKCKQIFNTKFNLQLHEFECIQDTFEFIPNSEILHKMYEKLPVCVVELDDNNEIYKISVDYKRILKLDKEDILHKNIHQILKNNQLKYDYIDSKTVLLYKSN